MLQQRLHFLWFFSWAKLAFIIKAAGVASHRALVKLTNQAVAPINVCTLAWVAKWGGGDGIIAIRSLPRIFVVGRDETSDGRITYHPPPKKNRQLCWWWSRRVFVFVAKLELFVICLWKVCNNPTSYFCRITLVEQIDKPPTNSDKQYGLSQVREQTTNKWKYPVSVGRWTFAGNLSDVYDILFVEPLF